MAALTVAVASGRTTAGRGEGGGELFHAEPQWLHPFCFCLGEMLQLLHPGWGGTCRRHDGDGQNQTELSAARHPPHPPRWPECGLKCSAGCRGVNANREGSKECWPECPSRAQLN